MGVALPNGELSALLHYLPTLTRLSMYSDKDPDEGACACSVPPSGRRPVRRPRRQPPSSYMQTHGLQQLTVEGTCLCTLAAFEDYQLGLPQLEWLRIAGTKRPTDKRSVDISPLLHSCGASLESLCLERCAGLNFSGAQAKCVSISF